MGATSHMLFVSTWTLASATENYIFKILVN